MNTRGFLASGSLLLFALPRENAFLSLPAAAAPRLAFKRVAAIKEDGAPATPATPAHDYFDLVVLGAGPVGVSAALAAADLGKRVCLVDAPAYSGALLKDGEDLSLGGPTGLFSKALRDTSKRLSVSTLRGMGISEKSIWSEVRSVCEQLAAVNARDRRRALASAGVEYVQALASLQPAPKAVAGASSPRCAALVSLAEEGAASAPSSLSAAHVLVATGSRAFRPAGVPFEDSRVLDSDSINGLGFLPRSVAITGSGIIAVEYAKIFQRLGADVTMLIRDKVPKKALMKIGLDGDLAAALVTDLVRCGVRIERGTTAVGFDLGPSCAVDGSSSSSGSGGLLDACGAAPLKITLDSGKVLTVDAYLAAVGRVSNTDHLNLASLGVEVDPHGCTRVLGRSMQTHAPGVFAAGDVVGRPYLASTGVAQAAAAVASMFKDDGVDDGAAASPAPASAAGEPAPRAAQPWQAIWPFAVKAATQAAASAVEAAAESTGGEAAAYADSFDLATNPFAFPVGVWSSPEVAYFGLSLAQAKARGLNASEGLALYRECLRGCVFSPEGFLKLVFDQDSGRVVGVHVVGDDACELIHYGMELVRGQRTVAEVNSAMYSAVTFHELYQIAARAALHPAAARRRRREAGAAWASLSKATRQLRSAD